MAMSQTLAERRKLLAARLALPPDDFDADAVVQQVYTHHLSQLHASPKRNHPSPSNVAYSAPPARRSGGGRGVRPLWLLVVMLSVLAAARLLLAAPPHVKPDDEQRRVLARSSHGHGHSPKAVWELRSGVRFRFTRISYGKYHCEPGVRRGEAHFAPCQQPNPNLLFLYTPLNVPAGKRVPVVVHFHGGARGSLVMAARLDLINVCTAFSVFCGLSPCTLRKLSSALPRPRRLRLRPRLRQARERRRRQARRGAQAANPRSPHSPTLPFPPPCASSPWTQALLLPTAKTPNPPGLRRHRAPPLQRRRLRVRPLPPRSHGVRVQFRRAGPPG